MAPSKSFFKMKLTTPATASAPYTEDAPPVTTSTRWIAAAGMELMSTAILAFTGIARRPSISTRLRLGARPRKLSVEAPAVSVDPVLINSPSAMLVNWVAAGTNCGSLFNDVSMAIALVSSNTSASMVWIGLLASKSLRTIRDPVMVTSSSSGAGSAL